MIVSHFRIFFRFRYDFLQSLESKSDRTDSHGSTIAPAIIGLALFRPCPLVEKSPISGIWVTAIIGFHHWYVISVGQNRIGQGYGEHAVIGEKAGRAEKLKSLGFDMGEA